MHRHILLAMIALAGTVVILNSCRPRGAVEAYEGPSAVIEITSTQQFDDLVAAEPVVLVDFNATWCYPCKLLAPIVDKLSADYDGRVKILSVDVDENQELAGRYGIRSIPTIILFQKGEQVHQEVGLIDREVFDEMLAKVLPEVPAAPAPEVAD